MSTGWILIVSTFTLSKRENEIDVRSKKKKKKEKEDRFLVSIPVGNWKKVENTQVYSRGNNLGGTKVCVFQLREVFVFSLTEDLEGGTLADNVCES